MCETLRVGGLAVSLAVTLAFAGCGSDEPPARQDILDTPKEELYGASTKSVLYEFRAKVRKRGAAAAKLALPEVLENFEGYEQLPLGEHLKTYEELAGKLKALETTLSGSPTDEQVREDVDAIADLAAKLPGKAEENPEVE
jgi:hypothetical protein